MLRKSYILVKRKPILFWIAFACIALYSIMETSTTALMFMSQLRIKMIRVATFCCVCLINEFLLGIDNRRYFKNTCFSLLLIISLFLGAYYGTDNSNIIVVARFVAYIMDVLILTVVASENDWIVYIIRFLLVICVLLCIINDFVDLSGFRGFLASQTSVLRKYVIGTKFGVVYLHLNTLVLFVTNILFNKNIGKKIIVFVYISLIAIMGIAIYVDCNTGLIGAVVYAAMFTLLCFGSKNIKSLLTGRCTFLVCIVLATTILFVLHRIVSIPFVTSFIVNTLNRDITLTGRLEIFSLYSFVMKNHWLWGYGLGTAYQVSMENFGAANAQNFVLQWVLQIGIVPVIALSLWIVSYFGRICECKESRAIIPIVALLYTYIWLGIGEITMNYNFFMFTFVLGNIANHVMKDEYMTKNLKNN